VDHGRRRINGIGRVEFDFPDASWAQVTRIDSDSMTCNPPATMIHHVRR